MNGLLLLKDKMLSLFDGTNHHSYSCIDSFLFVLSLLEDEVLVLGPSVVEVVACTKPEQTVIVTFKVSQSLVNYLSDFDLGEPVAPQISVTSMGQKGYFLFMN